MIKEMYPHELYTSFTSKRQVCNGYSAVCMVVTMQTTMQTCFLPFSVRLHLWGIPLITYAPRGRGWGQASYTFPLRITCKKGGEGVQKACKIAYVINGRPLSPILYFIGLYQRLAQPDILPQLTICYWQFDS